MTLDQENADLTFFRERQVLELFPFSRSQLWALIKRGQFPAPVKLSERCSAWRSTDLRDHAKSLKTSYQK